MFNIFCPYYNDNANFRQQELDWCLNHNDKNPLIDNVFVFPESRKDRIPKLSEKTHIIHYDRRVTYKDIVDYINNTVDAYRYYNLIINTDIYFDETINLIKTIDMTNVCLALTRWEVNINKPNEPYMYMSQESQDVWAFKGYININVQCDFYMGLLGCDGRFDFELRRVGYKLYNPSKDVRALHYHMSGKRNHSEDTRLQGDTIVVPIVKIKDIDDGKNQT